MSDDRYSDLDNLRFKSPVIIGALMIYGMAEYWVKYTLPRFIPTFLAVMVGVVIGHVL